MRAADLTEIRDVMSANDIHPVAVETFTPPVFGVLLTLFRHNALLLLVTTEAWLPARRR